MQPTLWGDEIFTVYWVKQSLSFILGDGRYHEANPPLYYLILWAWTRLAGTSELAVRLPSIVFSMAALGAAYHLARKLFSRSAGYLALALLALNPIQIVFGSLARGYSLQGFLILTMLIGFAGCFEKREPGASRPFRLGCVALYAASGVALVYTHYVQSFFVAACGLCGLAACFRMGHGGVRTGRYWIGIHLLMALACLGALFPMMTLNGSAPISWVPTPEREFFVFVATMLVGNETVPSAVNYFILGLLATVIFIFRQGLFLPPVGVVLFYIPLVFLVMLTAVSYWHSVFIARVLVCLPLCFWIAVAAMGACLENTGLKAGLVTLAMFACIVQALSERSHSRAYALGSQILETYSPEDVIVIGPRDPIGWFDYYTPKILRNIYVWSPFSRYAPSSEDYLYGKLFAIKYITTEQIVDNVKCGNKVRLFISGYPSIYYPYLYSKMGFFPTRHVEEKQLYDLYSWN